MKRTASRWQEKEGGRIIRFREPLVSEGWSGKRWFLWFRANKYQVGSFAHDALLSPAFAPTRGAEYRPVILKWPLWNDEERTIDEILRTAGSLVLGPATMEMACLMRKAYSDDEFEAMGARWLNAVHPSVRTAHGLGELDIISRIQGGRWLSGHVRSREYRHPRDEAFLFDEMRGMSRGLRPPSSLPPEPEDFDDPEQMKAYLSALRKFFRIE